MNAVLYIWLIAAVPTQKCIDAWKEKAAAAEKAGVVMAQKQPTTQFETIASASATIPQGISVDGECFDVYAGKVPVAVDKMQLVKPKSVAKTSTKPKKSSKKK